LLTFIICSGAHKDFYFYEEIGCGVYGTILRIFKIYTKILIKY
jgi:hypothetical protein